MLGLRKEVIQERLSDGKESSYWYGGILLNFHTNNGGTIIVSAMGDIDLVLINKDSPQVEVCSFRDRFNGGSLSNSEIAEYINDDGDLYAYIRGDSDKEYELVVNNNNWYEASYIDRKRKFS